MHVTLTVVSDRGGLERRVVDAVVDAAPETPLADVLAALRELTGAHPTATPRIEGATRTGPALSPTAPLRGSALREATVVTFDPASDPVPTEFSTPALSCSLLELRVVGGPDAGAVIRLPLGATTIGRAADCDVRLDDPDVSRRHACDRRPERARRGGHSRRPRVHQRHGRRRATDRLTGLGTSRAADPARPLDADAGDPGRRAGGSATRARRRALFQPPTTPRPAESARPSPLGRVPGSA